MKAIWPESIREAQQKAAPPRCVKSTYPVIAFRQEYKKVPKHASRVGVAHAKGDRSGDPVGALPVEVEMAGRSESLFSIRGCFVGVEEFLEGFVGGDTFFDG